MESTEDYVERLNMCFEENRLKSFKTWPYKHTVPCNIKKLAEAGFFWTGTEKESDSAQCFVCNKQLDGWESTDDPWSEHRKHSPRCSFVKIGKKEDDITVEQFYNLWGEMTKNLAKNKIEDATNELKLQFETIRGKLLASREKTVLSDV